MSKVVAVMSMSLDGFVAGPHDGVAEVFDWCFNSGDVEFHTGGSDPMTFKVSEPSARHLRGLWAELGAVLTGRRTFEVAQGWGGNHAWGPAFVLTHHVPTGWPRPDSTVHLPAVPRFLVRRAVSSGMPRKSCDARGRAPFTEAASPRRDAKVCRCVLRSRSACW